MKIDNVNGRSTFSGSQQVSIIQPIKFAFGLIMAELEQCSCTQCWPLACFLGGIASSATLLHLGAE